MGIDGLPDSQQPSPSAAQQYRKQPASSSKKENRNCRSAPASAAKAEKKKRVIPESMNREPLRSLSCNVGGGEARSLPDTPPRASTSARASWDGPRLSLQALKESVLDRAAQYMSMPSSPTSSSAGKMKNACSRRRRQDERAAKEHAREILRQAKENVASRKSSSKSSKSRSSSPAPEKRRSSVFNDNKENVLTSPAAPAPAAVEDKHKLVVVQAAGGKPMSAAKVQQGTTEHPPSQSPCRVPLAPRQPPPPQRAKPSRPPPPPPPLDPPTRARKPDGCERFATRIKKQPAAAGGQAPASASASPVVALPSAPASSSGSAAVPLEEDPEYGYLRSVLERGGFMRSAPPPRRPFKGHNSVASPVDPIVFHLLELELPADEARLGPLRHRWNRKLLFHLAQELLADLLLGLDSPAPAPEPSGPPLLGMVWRKVRSFPAADCQVVGDIDALVAADLEAARVRRLERHPAVAQEAADVAEEVAERVLEALLGECVSVAVCVAEESGSAPACAGRRT
ncbi:hypothetical protein PVAP13_7NG078790 [Panicum virgatum]|nr:hypothetical protein PVAP13_7NG078790 [Panicum virgatum]